MWIFIAGLLANVIALKYILICEVKIRESLFKNILDYTKKEPHFKFVFNFEFLENDKVYPREYSGILKLKNVPWMHVFSYERLFTAGWRNKENVSKIYCFRFSRKKIVSFLDKLVSNKTRNFVEVMLLSTRGTDKIGNLDKFPLTPRINQNILCSVENSIQEIFQGKIKKIGLLLYGTPGNGKTTFQKYLAFKYNLNINIVSLSPDYTNEDIIYMFSEIKPNSLVSFEDFDTYFNGRSVSIGNDKTPVKFSFDVFLNVLDGLYNSYENCIFVMTCNDLSKIDPALKNRPGRFKHVIEFSNPTLEDKQKLLTNPELHSLDMSWDDLFQYQEK